MIPTPSQTVGPFFGVGLNPVGGEGDIRVEGRVLDGAGEPVSDALIEAWHDDEFVRCRTDEEGAFHFRAPRARFLNVTVFARGLLRQVNTRMYLPGEEDELMAQVDRARRHTLVALLDGDVHRFDIRLQGPDETVFFT